jgi:non-specific serine/threonine protein kinase
VLFLYSSFSHVIDVKQTLLDFLKEPVLRDFAGSAVYARGVSYFRMGKVSILSANIDEAHCLVEGTQLYTINLTIYDGELAVYCSCPYADSGWFCKHMVAAGLAVRNHLEEASPSKWQTRLNWLVEGASTPKGKEARPYWAFVSLRQDSDGWSLIPYRMWLNDIPKGILPDDHLLLPERLPDLVQQNRWLMDHIVAPKQIYKLQGCVNGGEQEIALINLLVNQNRSERSSFYYAYSNIFPLAHYLPLLARSALPVFVGHYRQPIQRLVEIFDKPVEMRLRLEGTQSDGAKLTAVFVAGEQPVIIDHHDIDILTTKGEHWLLAGDNVFELSSPQPIEYLMPWLSQPELKIPPEAEDEFLDRYLPSLVSNYSLDGDAIQWKDISQSPVKRLYLSDEDDELIVILRFGYGGYEVDYEQHLPDQSIRRDPGTWTLARIQRMPELEEDIYRSVSSAAHGLKYSMSDYADNVFLLRARVHPIDFLMRHVLRLTEAGFEIYGEEKLKSARVNRHQPTLSLNVSSGIDWFDLEAKVKFGDVEASLKEVRKALRKKETYIKLADGTIGEIPPEWIERYKHLFGLGQQTDDGVRLSNHHLGLIDQLLADADRAQLDDEFHQRRSRLLDFEGIQPKELPSGFVGELRPYQQAGYDWLHFLHDFDFGGCLADDMGLGKTIETLAFLQSFREEAQAHVHAADLIVLPRSLLFNWRREAQRFTPDLQICFHYGPDRKLDAAIFDQHDLVLTTYGTMRSDIEFLREYKFHYVVLDESQAIKNPLAKTSKAARLLNSDHRLVLTGTPVENSTFELWSQFAFLNPGLLGNLEYFKREFGHPIERDGDESASNTLRKMVYPFILRRTKAQVAPELPPRTERIVYSDMQPAQLKFYNKTREYYRSMLMGAIEDKGMHQARMQVLEGLLRLRQICNHPKLVNQDFRGGSSKFDLLLDTLETLHSEGHKALIFSQFVKMLGLLRGALDERQIPYTYLDGRTRKRQERVDEFQNDPQIPFFLISLKAGGVGLNLTAADYVIHIDPWWNPAVEMQATDRSHRIGQEKPVFVYKLIVRDSVEEKILELQEKKKALVEQLITTESSFFKNLTPEEVDVLFS